MFARRVFFSLFSTLTKRSQSLLLSDPATCTQNWVFTGFRHNLKATRLYASGRGKDYNLFGNVKPKYRTISELLKSENEPEELSPGKKARKLAVENALKKLNKGPDGRYTNVWEVMSDVDILIGAFENIISGPEYEELRKGGPKRLNMQFFKNIQTRMRDPNFKFTPEIKLKPKSKLVPRKKWQKAQSRIRKAKKR